MFKNNVIQLIAYENGYEIREIILTTFTTHIPIRITLALSSGGIFIILFKEGDIGLLNDSTKNTFLYHHQIMKKFVQFYTDS